MNDALLHRLGNVLGLFLICAILILAFLDQLLKHDLPCPLCLLQRVSFAAMGLSLAMNLKVGIRTSHYGLFILSAFLGLSMALRQSSLHLAPGDPGYGLPFLGHYFYTWAFIAFGFGLVVAAIALLFEKGFSTASIKSEYKINILVIFFLFLILAEGVSTFIECGLICPDNPTHYLY